MSRASAGPGAGGPPKGGRSATPPRRKILVATFNSGKARELSRLLAPLDIDVVSPAEIGIREPYKETGSTYEENARGKARHYAALSGMTTLADDSGLEVEALGGRPGPLSARYGGEGLDDAARCRRLLDEMAGVPDARRAARYVAVAALAGPAQDDDPGAVVRATGRGDDGGRLFRATCEGRIARAPRGALGFGYDPIFFYPPLDATFGEIADDEKDRVSHRGQALRQVAAFLTGRDASSH